MKIAVQGQHYLTHIYCVTRAMAVSVESLQGFLWITVSLPSFPVCCCYLVMIIFLAPIWQQKTSPLQIRPILILHNFACSLVSIYAFFGFLKGILQSESMFQKGDSDVLRPVYRVYWLTKLLELLDTVFMIVRHRRRQISFLHVYHHSSILLLSDVAYHMYPWPGIAFYLMNNSFVHIVLYTYYGLSALFPDRSFPWKRHITELQIFQFFVGFVHATIGYVYHGFCIYGIFYGITMTVLFSNFYYKAYLAPKKRKEF